MNIGGPERVHIAPQGYETARIYKPAIEHGADRVVLLFNTNSTEQGKACKEEVEEKLNEEGIPHRT